MASAKSIFYFLGFLALIPAALPIRAPGQDNPPPPRPVTRIHDAGSVFEAGDRPRIAAGIQEKLEALHAETGCDVLVATVSTTTGTTPRILADQFALAWLDPARSGAVLLYERAGNRVVVSVTGPARDSIADYIFSSIEQTAAEDRKDASPAEAVSLAAGDLAAVFRKYFGGNAGREHPAIRADRLLMGAVAACMIGMLVLVASLHWRGEKLRA